jgi:hypothetical protein
MRTIVVLSLVPATMLFGVAWASAAPGSVSAAPKCLQWEWHTQKPAVCKKWSSPITHLPKDEKFGANMRKKCMPGQC